MSESLSALAPEALLFYKISTEGGSICLRIWDNGLHPDGPGYAFIVNWRVATIAQARHRLLQHLALNGTSLACDQDDLPMKGRVRLLNHPTWNQQG
ncbi:MAG: hypothetical protein KGQ93_10510 [Cyanobacteria bacterium REEB459]|nr:hypothetical protein [Cyanobacteria bacterium REEB459]